MKFISKILDRVRRLIFGPNMHDLAVQVDAVRVALEQLLARVEEAKKNEPKRIDNGSP